MSHTPKDGCCSHEGHSHAPKDGCCGHEGHGHAPKDGCCGHEGHGHAPKDGCCGHEGHDHTPKDGCCGHEGHGHTPKDGCCGHEGHGHAPKGGCCGHEGHDHTPKDGCCGHDHGRDDAWTRQFFLALQGVVLTLIGGLMCYFVASGRIDGRNPAAPYVVGGFRYLVLGGGIGIILMGIFNWLMRARDGGCSHGDGGCCGEEESAAHSHHHEGSVTSRAITLLVLSGSVAAAAVMTPDQFSSKYLLTKADAYRSNAGGAEKFKKENPGLAAASAEGGFTLEKVEQYVKRTKDGNFPLSVVNLHYMSSDPEYARVMEGQMIETTGQVVKDTVNPGPGHLRVFTLQTTCCAADARPFSIPFAFEDGKVPDYIEMGWYVVTGKLEFTEERGIKMARLKATNLQATIRPAGQRPDF